ncbi:MAG: hypothetical protein ACK5N8_07025 [Alphaproteobacteria bacterium]
MSDFDNKKPIENTQDSNRPRLKKVKRPVKRPVGQFEGNAPQKAVVPTSYAEDNAPYVPTTTDAFNLDEYLDEEKRGNNFVQDEDLYSDKTSKFRVGNLFTINFVVLVGIGALFLGLIMAKLFFSQEKVVQGGLQGVVFNPEVPRGRARCGSAERTQGCILYIMNPQRQELKASDFYDLAAQMAGRQRFVIETGNIRYSNVKIQPGEIAQFNIPPL